MEARISVTRAYALLPIALLVLSSSCDRARQGDADGNQPVTTPYSTISVVGMQRSVGSGTPPTVNGVRYGLAVWSDGGASTHSFYTADADTTYTATFYPARVWVAITGTAGQ